MFLTVALTPGQGESQTPSSLLLLLCNFWAPTYMWGACSDELKIQCVGAAGLQKLMCSVSFPSYVYQYPHAEKNGGGAL